RRSPQPPEAGRQPKPSLHAATSRCARSIRKAPRPPSPLRCSSTRRSLPRTAAWAWSTSSSAATAKRNRSTRGISTSPRTLPTESRSRAFSRGNTLRVSMNAYTFRIQQPEVRRVEVGLQLPAGWRAWNALPFEDGAFKAQDYDELADSPFECGAEGSHSVHAFVAQGVQHELVVWGRGDFDARRVVPDLVKIVDAEAAIFGGLPYSDRYLFILHLNDKARGGLEHRRSCALIVPRFSFVQKNAYEDFLLLVAHEFFHLWNVKRVRPSAFTPYDWTRENH